MKIKALSWNIWCGMHLGDMLDFLKTADANIIALQEVVKDETENMAVTIAKRLGYECVHAVEMQMPMKFLPEPLKKEGGIINFGNAILSKHKIISSQAFELSNQQK